MLLSDAFPELARELKALLRREGEHSLADQLPGLRVVDRCRCGDSFCATMYTVPKPRGPWEPRHESIDLNAEHGVLVLDVNEGRIVSLEVLYRDEIRHALLRLLP